MVSLAVLYTSAKFCLICWSLNPVPTHCSIRFFSVIFTLPVPLLPGVPVALNLTRNRSWAETAVALNVAIAANTLRVCFIFISIVLSFWFRWFSGCEDYRSWALQNHWGLESVSIFGKLSPRGRVKGRRAAVGQGLPSLRKRRIPNVKHRTPKVPSRETLFDVR